MLVVAGRDSALFGIAASRVLTTLWPLVVGVEWRWPSLSLCRAEGSSRHDAPDLTVQIHIDRPIDQIGVGGQEVHRGQDPSQVPFLLNW
ncbi:hypothetical protein [Mycolicibacterium sp. XJ870]